MGQGKSNNNDGEIKFIRSKKGSDNMGDIIDEAEDLLKIISSHDTFIQLIKIVTAIKDLTIAILIQKSKLIEKKSVEDPLEEITDSIIDLLKGTGISLQNLLEENKDLSNIDKVEYFRIRDENTLLLQAHKLELEIFLKYITEKRIYDEKKNNKLPKPNIYDQLDKNVDLAAHEYWKAKCGDVRFIF
jgi:hypothetical protein